MGQTQGLGSNSTAEEAAGDIRLDDKVVIVTGSNTGIGKETARVLVRMGAHVIMACRDIEKAKVALSDINEDTGTEDKITLLPLDLGSFQSIRNFVDEFHALKLPLHILINNAGVMATPEKRTEDGIEYQIGINHFGHFLLTNLLLEDLKNNAPARIVNLSSTAHKGGRIFFDNINLEGNYEPWRSYGQSKLANILFTKALAKRLEGTGVTCNSLHPGVISTELTRDLGWLTPFLNIATSLKIIKTIPQGAATTIYVATHPDLEGVTGLYFNDCHEETPSVYALREEDGERLWELSLVTCKLVDEPPIEGIKETENTDNADPSHSEDVVIPEDSDHE